MRFPVSIFTSDFLVLVRLCDDRIALIVADRIALIVALS